MTILPVEKHDSESSDLTASSKQQQTEKAPGQLPRTCSPLAKSSSSASPHERALLVMMTPSEGRVVAPLDQSELERLHEFHLLHFPGQTVPSSHGGVVATSYESLQPIDDDLGLYNDGVRRTLTNEQVGMFRHSEIQRLLLARRLQREKDEEDSKRKSRTKDRPANKQRHFDQPEKSVPVVDSLTYDDEPAASNTKEPVEKKFLWPDLRK